MVSWAEHDREAAESIVEKSEGTAILAPPTPSARLLAALLTMSKAVVAADTGVVHLAVILHRPVVALYGPKNPDRYGPRTDQGRSLSAKVPCSPCGLRHCEHAICMQSIWPAEVETALVELLNDQSVLSQKFAITE